MRYLLDTTVLVESLRGNESAKEFLKEANVSITAVTVAELIQGSKNTKEQSSVLRLCNSVSHTAINEEVIKYALELLYEFYLPNGLKFWDALIASVAIKYEMVLVTANLKHFRFIKELAVISQREALKFSRN